MKKILYIYTRGRTSKIENSKDRTSPVEFLYGYNYFKNKGYQVDYIELDKLPQKKLSFRYIKLRIIDFIYRKSMNLANTAYYYVGVLDMLQSYDCLIATTDAVALGLTYYVKRGILKTPVIYLQMGLADRLYKLEKKNTFFYNILKKNVIKIIEYSTKIIFLGLGEYTFFVEKYKIPENKLCFIPFGIDVEFWNKMDEQEREDSFVLFVGNDINRDYNLLKAIARRLPQRKFRFVTKRISEKEVPSNVVLNQGSFSVQAITDVELKKLYNRSRLVIIPLEDTIQPSGQSVALQAMACGTPVIISNTRGFWEPESYVNNKNILFVDSNSVDEWAGKIEKLYEDNDFYKKLGDESRKSVVQKYTTDIFNKKLEQIVAEN